MTSCCSDRQLDWVANSGCSYYYTNNNNNGTGTGGGGGFSSSSSNGSVWSIHSSSGRTTNQQESSSNNKKTKTKTTRNQQTTTATPLPSTTTTTTTTTTGGHCGGKRRRSLLLQRFLSPSTRTSRRILERNSSSASHYPEDHNNYYYNNGIVKSRSLEEGDNITTRRRVQVEVEIESSSLLSHRRYRRNSLSAIPTITTTTTTSSDTDGTTTLAGASSSRLRPPVLFAKKKVYLYYPYYNHRNNSSHSSYNSIMDSCQSDEDDDEMMKVEKTKVIIKEEEQQPQEQQPQPEPTVQEEEDGNSPGGSCSSSKGMKDSCQNNEEEEDDDDDDTKESFLLNEEEPQQPSEQTLRNKEEGNGASTLVSLSSSSQAHTHNNSPSSQDEGEQLEGVTTTTTTSTVTALPSTNNNTPPTNIRMGGENTNEEDEMNNNNNNNNKDSTSSNEGKSEALCEQQQQTEQTLEIEGKDCNISTVTPPPTTNTPSTRTTDVMMGGENTHEEEKKRNNNGESTCLDEGKQEALCEQQPEQTLQEEGKDCNTSAVTPLPPTTNTPTNTINNIMTDGENTHEEENSTNNNDSNERKQDALCEQQPEQQEGEEDGNNLPCNFSISSNIHNSQSCVPTSKQDQEGVTTTTAATLTSSAAALPNTIGGENITKNDNNHDDDISSSSPWLLTPTPKHDEYIDYSCSTSMERLTREVETFFRAWHIHNGADQHASFFLPAQPQKEQQQSQSQPNEQSHSQLPQMEEDLDHTESSCHTTTGAAPLEESNSHLHNSQNTMNHNDDNHTVESSTVASFATAATSHYNPPSTPILLKTLRDPRTIPNRSKRRLRQSLESSNSSASSSTPLPRQPFPKLPQSTPSSVFSDYHNKNNNNKNNHTSTIPSTVATPILPPTTVSASSAFRSLRGVPLRVATFTWMLSFYIEGTKVSTPIDLQLALWEDQDLEADEHGDDHEMDDDDDDNTYVDYNCDLPFSVQPRRLRRQQLRQRRKRRQRAGETNHNDSSSTTTSLFSNLSTLFGIGQHITLTPVVGGTRGGKNPADVNLLDNPFRNHRHSTGSSQTLSSSASTGMQGTVESSSPDWLLNEFLQQYLVPSVLMRHDDDISIAASASVAHVLSQWLQTALNLAAAQTKCQIPVFGWWGPYNEPLSPGLPPQPTPSPSFPPPPPGGPNRSSSTTALAHYPNGSSTGSSSPSNNIPLALPPSIQRTCSSTMLADDASHATSATNASSNHPLQLLDSCADLDTDPNIVIIGGARAELELGFPTWLHDTHQRHLKLPAGMDDENNKKKIPSMSIFSSSRQRQQQQQALYRRRRRSSGDDRDWDYMNLKHLPPLVAGTCFSSCQDHGDDDKRISFWVGALPQSAAPSTARTRLATWGDLLLRYCPLPPPFTSNNDGDDKSDDCLTASELQKRHAQQSQQPIVHLWFARHVYCWTKQLQSSIFVDGLDPYGSSPPSSSSPRNRNGQGPHAASSSWRPVVPWAEDSTSRSSSQRLRRQQQQNADLSRRRRQLQHHLLQLVSTAAGASDEDPLWGPVDDPIDSLWAFVTWKPVVTTAATAQPNEKEQQQDTTKMQEQQPRQTPLQPLLQLPLKIRSSQAMSREDWMEAEEAIETSILNPLRAVSFALQVRHDTSVIRTPLAAMQHCLLAALIRTSTLPCETLLNDLTDAAVMEQWDTAAGNVIARTLAQQAPGVGSTTLALVDAMDWAYAMDDLIEPWQALDIVRQVLDTTVREAFMIHGGSSTEPLDEVAKEDDALASLLKPLPKAAPFGRLFSILCAYISRVRSPSSMVQVFGTFVHELRRRWDFRELLPNMETSLRGFDVATTTATTTAASMGPTSRLPSLAAFMGGTSSPRKEHSQEAPYNQQLSNEHFCLIGQKLQVFHVCLESVIAEEMTMQQHPRSSSASVASRTAGGQRLLDYESLPPVVEASPRASRHAPLGEDEDVGYFVDDASILTFDTATKLMVAPSKDNTHNSNHMKDDETDKPEETDTSDKIDSMLTLSQDVEENGDKTLDPTANTVTNGQHAKAQKRFSNDAPSVASNYCDAQSVSSQSIIKAGGGVGLAVNSSNNNRSMSQDDPSIATMNSGQLSQYFDAADQSKNGDPQVGDMPEWMTLRKGARCPVEGQCIRSNGHQVFAPYLQRLLPLTDDLVAQQRLWLEQRWNSNNNSNLSPTSSERDLMERIEVAHMIQRPKLLSDMSAFKAANPGCALADFIEWYGEPKPPLLDDEQQLGQEQQQTRRQEEGFFRLNSSTRILELTCAFWSKTWEKAPSVPASEQEPLFRASDTVEIALDYLETLHPASLIISVMATNLSNAYFSLVISASVGIETGEDATQLPIVHASLMRLRHKIETALNLLSSDTISPRNNQNYQAKQLLLHEHEQYEHPDNMALMIPTRVFSYTSVETLSACETACRAIGENEALLANALSLLHKFPKQYEMVEQLLRLHYQQLQQQHEQRRKQRTSRTPRGSSNHGSKTTAANTNPHPEVVCTLDLKDMDPSLRQRVLESIAGSPVQPPPRSSSSSWRQPQPGPSTLLPVLREYMFRNDQDQEHPCQLTVRSSDTKRMDPTGQRKKAGGVFGGLMIAMTRTESVG